MEVLQEMKERFWLKPVAILLGILSWFYVNILSTTPITREYKVKIAYLNKDDSKNYKVIPEGPEVKIRVKGPRGVFIQTKVEENTFASVDLINCHGGKLTLPVNVIFPSNSNLQLISKEPAQLVINAIKMATKNINIHVNVIGNVPDGYMSSEPSISPNYLSVTAPQDVIDTIKECRIDLYLDDVKRSISEYRQAHIIYMNGTIETDLNSKLISVDNNNVKLDLAVREGYPEKSVIVRPDIINKPPEGRKLESYKVAPEKITITGSAKLLEKIDYLSLEQIDLEKVKKSSSLPLQIKLPKGVKAVNTDKATLEITYSDVLITKNINNLPLDVTHDEEQLVEYDISTYSVELEGFIDDINAIKTNEMKNIIYVKGLSAGIHQIPLEIPYGFSERVKVKSITPASISVTIKLLEKIEDHLQEEPKEKTDSSIISSDSTEITTFTEDKPQIILTSSDSQVIEKIIKPINENNLIASSPENIINKEQD